MDSITEVTPRYHVSGDPCYSANLQADLDLIYRRQLVVIDCRSEDERRDGWDEVVREGTEIVYAPLHDDGIGCNSVDDFLTLESELRLRGLDDRRFMIHCHMGVNRAPSVAMFLMLRQAGYSPARAFNRIRSTRTGAGIAYARTAIHAALVADRATRTHVNVTLAAWDTWEDRYWTPERNLTVNDAIIANRRATKRRGGTWIDDRGLIHAINN